MAARRKKADSKCNLACCTVSEARGVEIRESISRWTAGGWAKESADRVGAACICGLKSRGKWLAAGGGVPTGECARHEKKEVEADPDTVPPG